VLRALVRGSAERLRPVTASWDGGTSLPGWQLRVLDGNHLPASEKRLAPLRGYRGAAMPGHTLVVYDPDCRLVTDILPCEDAYQSERAAVTGLLDSAQPGQLWIADRQFCTRTVLLGWQAAQAGFLVREHGRHPKLAAEGPWRACGRSETGAVREQRIELAGASEPWRRIELTLDTSTEAGESVIRLWSNLPERVDARQIAQLYRTRWCVEVVFPQMTKTDLLTPRAGGQGVTDLHVGVRNDHPVDEQQDELAALFEARLGQAPLHPLSERLQ
jgi:IS4 transposase